MIPGRARSKTFPVEFMKEHFGKDHQEAFHEEIKAEGAPDMGSGRYSSKLSYKAWYEFNSAQRAHYNFVEWIASTLVLIAVSGVYFPIPAAALGLTIFIARIIYSVGYAMGGPRGRSIGALINDVAFLGVFVLSFLSSVYFIIGKDI